MDVAVVAYNWVEGLVESAEWAYEQRGSKISLSVVAQEVYDCVEEIYGDKITKTDITIATMRYFNTHGPEPWMDLNAKDIVEMHVWATL